VFAEWGANPGVMGVLVSWACDRLSRLVRKQFVIVAV
jgi:hypothetical protein